MLIELPSGIPQSEMFEIFIRMHIVYIYLPCIVWCAKSIPIPEINETYTAPRFVLACSSFCETDLSSFLAVIPTELQED